MLRDIRDEFDKRNGNEKSTNTTGNEQCDRFTGKAENDRKHKVHGVRHTKSALGHEVHCELTSNVVNRSDTVGLCRLCCTCRP